MCQLRSPNNYSTGSNESNNGEDENIQKTRQPRYGYTPEDLLNGIIPEAGQPHYSYTRKEDNSNKNKKYIPEARQPHYGCNRGTREEDNINITNRNIPEAEEKYNSNINNAIQIFFLKMTIIL